MIRIYKRGPAAGVKVAARLITPPDVAEPALEPVSEPVSAAGAKAGIQDIYLAEGATLAGSMLPPAKSAPLSGLTAASVDFTEPALKIKNFVSAADIQIVKERLELSQKEGELLKKETQNYKQKADMFKAACETLEARKQD